MTIWISWELPLFNFERLDMWCSWIAPPCDNLWPFEFLESFRCSISRISIYDVPESDILVERDCHIRFTFIMCTYLQISVHLRMKEIAIEVKFKINLSINWIWLWSILHSWYARPHISSYRSTPNSTDPSMPKILPENLSNSHPIFI